MSISMVSKGSASPGAQALRWWSREQQLRIVMAMEQMLRAWEQDWGLSPAHAVEDAVFCRMAFEDPGEGDPPDPPLVNWKPVALSNASEPACQLWWDASPGTRPVAARTQQAQARRAVDTDLVSVLLVALFGSPSEPLPSGEAGALAEVAVETAKAAWADLWRRIGQVLRIPVATDAPSMQQDSLATLLPELQCFQAWSGAVIVTLHWCGQELRILLGGTEAEAFLRHQQALASPPVVKPLPLTPLWDAVSALPCTVRAELTPVELGLGVVKALRVGDVVELSHPLDLALLAKSDSGQLLCEAFLGKAGNHRAIELLRSPARPF